MLPLLAPALAAVCLFILQGTLLSGLQLDLLTPVVLYVALEMDLTSAAVFAIGLGFLSDLMGVFFGLNIALNVGAVLVARLLRRHLLLRRPPARLVAVAACLLARSTLLPLAAAFFNWPGPGGLLALRGLAEVAGGTLVSLPLFAALDRAMESLALRRQPL
jgi:hypothetical protein